MILNFDDYRERYLMDDTDDYLLEGMSISDDVTSCLKDTVDFIENQVIKNSMVVDHSDSYDKVEIKDTEIEVFGCKCKLDLDILNYNSDDDVDQNRIQMRVVTTSNYVNGLCVLSFDMQGVVEMVDGKITEWSESAIGHELRHAYVSCKIYNGVPKMTTILRKNAAKKWKEIYSESVSYIKYYNNNYPISEILEGSRFYKILFSIYRSDVSEVAAFTQQAYEYCKRCKSVDEVKMKMKETDLYRMNEAFKNILKILCGDDEMATVQTKQLYDEMKNSHGLKELPTMNELTKLFEKRYRKSYTNYGKVIALLCDKLNEGDGEIIDVKY